MAIKKGFTLIEVLVVVSLFSIVALVATQSLIRILGSTSNSNSTAITRENLEHAVSIFEREIINAKKINVGACSATSVTYIATDNSTNSFSCQTTGGITRLNQNGQALTSSQVNLTTCLITCLTPSGETEPNGVMISLEGNALDSSYDSTPVSLQTTVSLRSY